MVPFTDSRREALRGHIRRFAARLTRPTSGHSEAARGALVDLAAADVLKLCVSSAHGGAAERVEPLSLVVAREELAAVSGFHDAMFAVQGLSAHPILLAAPGVVKDRWLPRMADGRSMGAFAATEPEAGSDLAAMKTTARPADDGGYVLDGLKSYISNAGVADVYVVFAQVETAGDGANPLAAFVVPGDAPGIEVTPIDLMAAHVIGSVRLRGVRISADARLEGDGLSLCLSTLRIFRPTVGAAACGMAGRALAETIRRVKIRQQFGKTLAAQQSVRFTLAEMATSLQAARLSVYRAAWLEEDPATSEHERIKASSMAKLHATEAAQQIVDSALQLHGAAGLVSGGVIETLYREVRALRIYEGASEIQKLVIARELLEPRGDRGTS